MLRDISLHFLGALLVACVLTAAIVAFYLAGTHDARSGIEASCRLVGAFVVDGQRFTCAVQAVP